MRTIGRVFVAAEDIAVDAQTALATAAEAHGLEGVWVHGPPSGHGDSYATTAAAAVASVTTDLRIGVVLRLSAPDDILRLAEDLAVIDHCSSGRAEICLDGRWAGDLTWNADAVRLMTNLRSCAVGDRRLAVTPGPLQPAIPAVVLGPAVPMAGPGTVATLDDAARTSGVNAIDEPEATASRDRAAGPSDRVVLQVTADQTRSLVEAAASADTLRGAIGHLRGQIDRSDAQDVVFHVPAGPGDGDADEQVATLASVVAPILRANEDEVADLVLDTLKFRQLRTA